MTNKLIERLKAARDGLPIDGGFAEEHDAFQAAIAALEFADRMAKAMEALGPRTLDCFDLISPLAACRATTEGSEDD